MVAVLGDAGDVEHAVDAPVAAEVESVLHRSAGALPGDSATAPVPHQRANFDSLANRNGSPTSTINVAAAIGPIPGSSRSVVPCSSSSRVEVAFETADLGDARLRSWSTNGISHDSR